MGKRAPSTPDPAQTAQAQYKYNRQAAEDSARFNQISQQTPFGSTYYTGEIGEPGRTQHTELHPALSGIFFGGENNPGGLLGQIGSAVASPLDFSSFTALPDADSYGAERDSITQAVYDRALNLRRPGLEREREDIERTLWQQGIGRGSEAYRDEFDRYEDARGREMSDLSLASVLAGAQEHQRLASLAAKTRQQQIAEAEMARTRPTSDLITLLSGTAPGGLPGMPQFTQTNMVAPDYSGLVGSNYAARANQYGAQQGGMLGLLGQLGGAAIPLFSDRRLKSDIKPVGKLDNGLIVYSYRMRGGAPVQIGLMADEVEDTAPRPQSMRSTATRPWITTRRLHNGRPRHNRRHAGHKPLQRQLRPAHAGLACGRPGPCRGN